jgi:hypothetical protein
VRAPEPHQLLGVALLRGDIAGGLHVVLELAQLALRIERGADAAQGAPAPSRTQQLGQELGADVDGGADERQRQHEHDQHVHPDGVAAGLDAVDDERQ